MSGEGTSEEKQGNGRKDHKGGDQLVPREEKTLGENDRRANGTAVTAKDKDQQIEP